MPFLVGVDEAGLGPNLGPLVVSASVWHVETGGQIDLYRRLTGAVCGSPPTEGDDRLAIADSKQLYKQPADLAVLERTVLAALSAAGSTPATWREAFEQLDRLAAARLDRAPWHEGFNPALPIAISPAELSAAANRFCIALAHAGVKLVAIQSAALFPDRFNRWTERAESKGEVLSRLTLRLVRRVLTQCADEPTSIVCDKHGGRNRYGRLLQLAFPDALVEVRNESAEASEYRWGPVERRVSIAFRVKGESHLPTALASMTSKYLRELAMRAFNTFWQQHVDGLRPTAGYPLDARRFKEAIGPAQTRLGIADRVLWRVK